MKKSVESTEDIKSGIKDRGSQYAGAAGTAIALVLLLLSLLLSAFHWLFVAGVMVNLAVYLMRAKPQPIGTEGVPAVPGTRGVEEDSTASAAFSGMRVRLERRPSGWFLAAAKGAEAFAETLGLPDPLPLPMAVADLVIRRDLPMLESVLDKAVELRLPVNHECRLATDAEDAVWVSFLLGREADGTTLSGVVLDITDRKVLELEVQEDKRFIEELLDVSGAVFSVRNREMRLVRTNQAYEAISGYSLEEIYLTDNDRMLMGDYYQQVHDRFQAVLDGHYPVTYENTWVTKTGESRLFRWTNTGLLNPDGEVEYIVSVGIDITDRAQLEEQLKETVAELEAILDNSMVGISLVQDHRIVKCNQAAADILGYTAEELQGLETQRLFASGEAFRGFVDAAYPRIPQGLRHMDQVFRKKDGRLVECRVSAGTIRQGTIEGGIIYVLDDITEVKMVERALRRSETRFRAIFDRMASGLALISEDGYFQDVNESWMRITGYSREEARKLRVLDITHPEDLDISRTTMKAFVGGEFDQKRIEKRYLHKDGSVIWVDLIASGICEDTDPPRWLLISNIIDITERKAMEVALQKTYRTLEQEKSKVQELADHRMAIFQLFDIFRRSNSLEDLVGILRNFLPKLMAYRNLIIGLKQDRDDTRYRVVDILGESSDEDLSYLMENQKGIIGSVMRGRCSRIVGDVTLDPDYQMHHSETRSYLSVPIIYQDFLWGVIGVDHTEANHFTEQDEDTLNLLGTLIALQMEEMTSKQDVFRESRRLKHMHVLVQQLAMSRTAQEIQALVTDSGLFDEIHINLRNPDGLLQPCQCKRCLAIEAPVPPYIDHESISSPKVWVESGRETQYHLATPIRFGSAEAGILCASSMKVISESDVEVASILAEQVGVFLELNALIRQREYEALIDPLTGVWNRRYMITRMEQEDDRILRYGGSACVSIMDLGDFKLINDIYGHLIGDEVLRGAARCIQESIRKTDYVGRFGGDEFIIFLPNTANEEGEVLIRRVSERIASLKVPGVEKRILADYGVACVPTDGQSLLEAIKVADEQMYQYKRRRKAEG